MRKGNRRVLPAGFELNGKSRIYTIEKYISPGNPSLLIQRIQFLDQYDVAVPRHKTVRIERLIDNGV